MPNILPVAMLVACLWIVACLFTATILTYSIITSHRGMMQDVAQRAQYLDSRTMPHVAPREPLKGQ